MQRGKVVDQVGDLFWVRLWPDTSEILAVPVCKYLQETLANSTFGGVKVGDNVKLRAAAYPDHYRHTKVISELVSRPVPLKRRNMMNVVRVNKESKLPTLGSLAYGTLLCMPKGDAVYIKMRRSSNYDDRNRCYPCSSEEETVVNLTNGATYTYPASKVVRPIDEGTVVEITAGG